MSACAIQLSKRYGGLQSKPTWFCTCGVWWDCDKTPTQCPVASARANALEEAAKAVCWMGDGCQAFRCPCHIIRSLATKAGSK